MDAKPHIVIVGAGFGGMNAARKLARSGHRITIIDKTNHHLFQPLLYQVATAGLSPADIAAPVRSEFRHFQNVSVILGEVARIDPAHKTLSLISGRQLSFDYLILATGARHGYFGNNEWEILAPGLKTLEDAVEIRRRILTSFEKAELEDDANIRQAYLTFVVIGAGPTGVEMAGAIAELARVALRKDYHHANLRRTKVILLEAGDRILQAFPETLSNATVHQLQAMGVEVRTKQRVTGLSESGVFIGDQMIATKCVIWGAGVYASSLGKQLGVACDKAGRVMVNPDLSVPGYPHMFVIGDLAAVSLKEGAIVPGVAPAAMQEGRHAASNILKLLKGRPSQAFHYVDKGNLATVGRTFAIAHVGALKLHGILARMIWTFVHIVYLISFRNKVIVFLQWAWSFFTFKKGARLITSDFTRDLSSRKTETRS